MATADADYIKSADVEAVRAKLGSRVVAVTGVMNNSDRMRVAGREEDVQIIGTDYYYPAVRNIALLSGRFVEEHEVAGRAKVAMLTERLATRLYGGLPQAVGQTIKLHDLQFSVIGTFKEKADTFGNTELGTETVLIPITVLRYFARIERIDPLYVQARTPDDVEGITREVRTVLEARHRAGAHYRVDNLGAILETAKSIATILTGVLLAVGRIDPQKNQIFAVEQLPVLLEHHPELHLVMIGAVTNQEYHRELIATITRLGLEKRVPVITGLAPSSQELVDAYHAADIFLLPSVHEPFGIVVLEAIERVNRELGAATAVITHNADIAGMADRVVHMSNGLVGTIEVNQKRKSPRELHW